MRVSGRFTAPGAALAATLAAALFALGSGAGCSAAHRRAPARVLNLAAFARTADESGPRPIAGDGPARPESRGPVREGAPDAPLPMVEPSLRDREEVVRERRLRPGERVVIDSMVGQINGRPIFADDFLYPLEDQLIAIRAQVRSPDQFAQEAASLVKKELQAVVLNALFLAEAESTLTVEQQFGLRAWLADLESKLISGHQGSEARARREIQEETDQTLEAHIEGIRDRALIREVLRDRVEPRVIVSWRDIEREYQRREQEFNPPPKFTLARIRLATERETARIEDVTRRLEAGEAFLAVAESLEQPGGGIWRTFEVPGGDLASIGLANEIVQEHVAALHDVGDTSDPFEFGRFTWWINLARVERPPGRDLFDPMVQEQLERQIHRVRSEEEQNRYIASLLEEGIYDELEEMSQRLLRIALLRYGP